MKKLNNMLLLPSVVLLVSGVLHPVSLEDSTQTYDYKDPVSGRVLRCGLCPPGEHVLSPCTAYTPTLCGPCAQNHYTEISNFLSGCLFCNNYCSQNQEVEEECSPLKNRVCRCKPGFYMMTDFCFEHSRCRPGQGVLRRGTSERNTKCERCSEGFFSSSSSATDSCSKHKTCSSNETLLLSGSSNFDTLCGSCQDLEQGGEALRKFLTQFFGQNRIRVRAMRRLISRNLLTMKTKRGSGLRRGRASTVEVIVKWIASAPDDELWKLQQMLRTVKRESPANTLTKTLESIENRSQHCNLTRRMRD